MRKWLMKQIKKLGLDSSNLKTTAELKGRILEYGESKKIKFPLGLDENQDWAIKKWNFKTGETVAPGDIIVIIESDKQRFEFESYVGGKLAYVCPIGQELNSEIILVEIKGE